MSDKGTTDTRRISHSRSVRAGLQFPVGRVHRTMKQSVGGARISADAPVYLAAVLEYVAAEVLELAGNAARDNKRSRITPRHMQLAISNDGEINTLTSGMLLAHGGVIPKIHASLLPKKAASKKR